MTPQQQAEYWKTAYEQAAARCRELAAENAKRLEELVALRAYADVVVTVKDDVVTIVPKKS